MKKHQKKIQKIVNNIKAQFTGEHNNISSSDQLKFDMLTDLLNDYYSAKEIIKERGEIVSFNKGTSFGNNPMFKIKYDAQKQITKLIKDLTDNKEEDDDFDDYINYLTSDRQ